jgi:hypothetical protein
VHVLVRVMPKTKCKLRYQPATQSSSLLREVKQLLAFLAQRFPLAVSKSKATAGILVRVDTWQLPFSRAECKRQFLSNVKRRFVEIVIAASNYIKGVVSTAELGF